MDTMQTYCQSCSMPMIEAGLYGTEANGDKSKEYCMYCYEQGAFLQSDVTMEEMIDLCTGVLTKEGMKEEEARKLLRNSIPYLNRWRQADLIEPTYISKEGFIFVGIGVRTTNVVEMTNGGKIPALWGKYYEEGVEQKILHQEDPSQTLGLYSNYESDVTGEYTFSTGKIVTDINNLPQNMMMMKVPAAKYAVFTTEIGPITEIVPKAWYQIWNWFERQDLERTYSGDFECYDRRSKDPNKAQVDIYIAIK